MTFDDLLVRIATEPPRTEEREVAVPDPALLAELRSRGWMRVSDFAADPRQRREMRTLRTGHVVGPPLSEAGVDGWQRQSPRHPLPTDLRTLLLRANGIHLWADLGTGRAYQGLAPLDEWKLARVAMWGTEAKSSDLSDRYLALSYHADSAAFATLDVDSGRYFLMDSAGADESCPIGESVDTLLDWLWSSRIP